MSQYVVNHIDWATWNERRNKVKYCLRGMHNCHVCFSTNRVVIAEALLPHHPLYKKNLDTNEILENKGAMISNKMEC